MKFCRMLVAVVITLGSFVPSVLGAEVTKIGVLDFQRVIDTSNVGKRSAFKMKNQSKEMEQTLKNKDAELEEVRKFLEQKAMVLSRDAREEKQRELRIKGDDLEALKKRYVEELRETNTELSNKIKVEVFDIVDEIGKKDGYTLILERRTSGVVFATESMDITDKVIEAYNAIDAKKSSQEKDKQN